MGYAKGKRAWGLCQKGGHRLDYDRMIEDDAFPGLVVDPTWYEPKHPQEIPVDQEDPQAIYRPAVEGDMGPLPIDPDGIMGIALTMTAGSIAYDLVDLPSVISIGPTYSASFFSSSVTVTVTRTGGTLACSATLSLSNGTAVGGTDFTATPIPVSFGVGEMSKNVNVPLIPANYDNEVLVNARTYHKLDEASGTTAVDSGPAHYDLTLAVGSVNRQQSRLNISGALPTNFNSPACFEVGSSTFNELKGNINFAVDGWAYHTALPTSIHTYWVNGGPSDDSSSAPNWQFWCSATNSSGVMHPWIFWEHGGGSDDNWVFTTLTIPLNTPTYLNFGRDVARGMVWAQVNNSYEEQPYLHPPDGGTSIVLGLGNNRDHSSFGMVGRLGQWACYLTNLRPSRYDRWKIGATRSFSAVLGSPTGCTISSDTATINLSETG